jgi:hypothetical protein
VAAFAHHSVRSSLRLEPMRQEQDSSEPEAGSMWRDLLGRRRAWLARRRATRNQQLLDAGRVPPDEPETDDGGRSPESDVFSWLGRNP